MAESDPVILILDDEPIVTTTIKNYLDLRGGYRTAVFNHPAQALEHLKTNPVDLIISDQMMPGMTGLEFFAQVKQLQPEAVRVLLTGYAQKDDAVRAINQIGLYQYIEKPWSNDQLELVLRNGLERKKLYTSLQSRIGELKIAAGEVDRLKNGLVELYLERSPQDVGGELRRIVGSEIRSGTRRLLAAFIAVSALLVASISYIVYRSFFSIRGETARLKIELREIQRNQLNPAEIKRLRETAAGARSEQIIAEYEESVCFIQGSYVFRDRDSGRLLRIGSAGATHSVDVSLEGSGPPVENFYTGTGFLAGEGGRILTNRHVAEPWWGDAEAQKILSAGFRPELRLLVAYFPQRNRPFPLKVRKVSRTADLALVEVTPAGGLPKPVLLEEGASSAAAGSPVLLIGYPLGLEAILARTSEKELEQIPDLPNLTLDRVARELASRGMIRPFITQGHISNVSPDVIAYVAVTSVGGSGGPLFDRNGRVIAVNFAIISQFQAASLGIPIRHARELLQD